jgi:hypothetical protein
MPDDVRPEPYYYAEGVIEDKPAFVRSLRSIIKGLELLGYTLLDCQRPHEEAIAAMRSY